MDELAPETMITVCAACRCASCWQGVFLCQSAREAGITKLSVAELRKLDREHADYWKRDEDVLHAKAVAHG